MKVLVFLQQNKRRLVYALFALCALLFAFFMGLLMRPPEKGDEDSAGVLSMLPDAAVRLKVRFEGCEHEAVFLGGESLNGKTRAEAESAYPGYELISFSSNEAVFLKTVSGYCPAHFVLRLEGNELGVYQTDEKTLFEKRLMVLAYDENALDAKERAELTEGVAFDDLNGVDAYLESAES